ncbi:MAG TPA: hypothetical protein ENK18_18765 [Deltaproteobacteria bacterium]|nr:hypothetical protein [Deltaproteobacteria bacterium]
MSGKNTGHGGAPPVRFQRDGDDDSYEKTLVFEDAGAVGEEPGFAFETFAQSEADAAAKAKARSQPPAEPQGVRPERRPILRRSYLPPGDVVVDARPVGGMTVVTLRGRINESFRGAELGRSLSGTVVFDLAEVDRVSSFGVKGWLQMLETSRMSACYFFRCSEAVINQITMMRNFCGPGHIHSLMVPYTCAGCGEEFGALYEAVTDREYILGRSPAKVECPNCHGAAEMDDDPWSYFALDEHLLEAVPSDLQQVVNHLTSTNRIDPIEKFISEQETRIRFNAPLDGRLRLRRAFSGLEGRVTLDLSVTPAVDPAGLHRLIGALRDLDHEVSEVWLDGAPIDLIRSLLTDPVRRVYVSSMFVEARCLANRITRPVLVDIDRRRQVLMSHRLPPIEANWAIGPVDISDTDVLFRAAAELGPNNHPPEPERIYQPPPAPYPHAPHPTPIPHHTAPPYQTQSTPHPILHAQQPPPPSNNTGLMWQAAAVAAFMSLVGAILVLITVGWIISSRTDLFQLPAVASGERSLESAAPQSEGWDGGNELPPPWVEQTFLVNDEQVLIVGTAVGTDTDETAERSKVAAIYELIRNLRQEIRSKPAGKALIPLEAGNQPDPDRVVDQYLRDVGDWATPERVNASIKRSAGEITVVTQHALPKQVWDRLVEYYGTSRTFRGLAVARRFPTDYTQQPHQQTPLVITQAASWFRSAAPQDGMRSVEGRSVTSPDDYVKIAKQIWNDLEEGERMSMQLYHGDRPAEVGFVRQTAPKPPSLELLPLEGP